MSLSAKNGKLHSTIIKRTLHKRDELFHYLSQPDAKIKVIHIIMLIKGKKEGSRFGHFGGLVLDFPIFIYW